MLILLCVFDCRGPGLCQYLENREEIYFFHDLVLQSSQEVLCDPFGIKHNPLDIFQGLGHAVFFHPKQLGRCHQIELLRDSYHQ